MAGSALLEDPISFSECPRYYRLSAEGQEVYRLLLKQITPEHLSEPVGSTNKETLAKAFEAFRRDHPLCFYFGDSFTYSTERTGNTENQKITVSLLPGITPRKALEMREELLQKAEEIVAPVKNAASEYEKALYVHDYLASTAEYAFDDGLCYTAYGCIVNRKTVCNGYADAFILLLRLLGIECGSVIGCKTGSSKKDEHIWNYARLDGEYCFVDVTWDTPKVKENTSRRLTHEYFGINSSELLRTHRILPGEYAPDCFDNKNNYYKRNRLSFSSYSFAAVLFSLIRQSQKTKVLSLRFDTPGEADLCVAKLLSVKKLLIAFLRCNDFDCFVSLSGQIISLILK